MFGIGTFHFWTPRMQTSKVPTINRVSESALPLGGGGGGVQFFFWNVPFKRSRVRIGDQSVFKFQQKNGKTNSPFPSCLKPLYQSEAWCTTIHMKMSLIYMWMKSHFHMKRWAPRLAMRKRLQVIRKRPNDFLYGRYSWEKKKLCHIKISTHLSCSYWAWICRNTVGSSPPVCSLR